MLSHFKPRGYKIRHATLDDLDAVVALEAGCRGLELRTPRSVLDDDELSVVSKEADVRVAKARAVRLLLAFEDGGTRPEPRGNQTSRRR